MRWLTNMWQRMFICTLVLILATQAVSYVTLNLVSQKVEALQIMAEITSDTSSSISGSTFEELKGFAKIFNNPQNKLWLEEQDGTLIVGRPVPGFTSSRRDFSETKLEGRSTDKSWNRLWGEQAENVRGTPLDTSKRESRFVRILETKLPEAEFIATTLVRLKDRRATMFLVFDKYRPWSTTSLFLNGLIAVTIIGGFLALWAARKISFPLRRLRDEVLDIAAGGLDGCVSDKGGGEITELAEAVNKLADNLSRKISSGQEIIANISHELRSPISRISFSATIVEEGMRKEYETVPSLPEKIKTRIGHMRIIQGEINRLDSLIDSCLMSSKLDMQSALTLFPVDFSALCGEVSQSYDALLESRGITLERNIRPGLWVQGDETLLCTAVSNLLDNALKYTASGGRVRVAVTEDKGHVLLDVENSHPFMPDDWFRSVFTPFCRGNIPTGNGEGVGLGLYLVEKIIILHYGQVSACNGEFGVCFTITLKQTDKEP